MNKMKGRVSELERIRKSIIEGGRREEGERKEECREKEEEEMEEGGGRVLKPLKKCHFASVVCIFSCLFLFKDPT